MFTIIATILLALSLFSFFYFSMGGTMPTVETKSIKETILYYGTSLFSAGAMFLATSYLFLTPLAGLTWATVGWFIPVWIRDSVNKKKKVKAQRVAKDFCKTAASLYSANYTTLEVANNFASRAPEPFATEFQNMVNQRNFNEYFSFSKEFKKLAKKYDLSEFNAASVTLEAEVNVGSKAAARGFKRLGRALEQEDKLAHERNKATYEPKIAAYVTIILLIAGLIADATVWRGLYSAGAGKAVVALASLLIVGMVFLVKKISISKDLA